MGTVKKLMNLVVLLGWVLCLPLGAVKPIPSGSLSLNQVAPRLGEYVTFTWSVDHLPGWATPRIQVICSQDDVVVYGEAGPAWQSFLLGGGSSDWLTNGGPAVCVATLYYWQFHPSQIFHPLDSVTFAAGG